MLPAFRTLVDGLRVLPGVGEKTATRMAAEILALPTARAERLMQGISEARQRIQFCSLCFAYAETDLCPVCSSESRATSPMLCVVERPLDVWSLESTARFTGRYHVLGGVLSPIDGVGPADIRLAELTGRIDTDTTIAEVLFALPATPEAEATAHVVMQSAPTDRTLSFTHLAYGIPVGGNLEFMDQRTLGFALENRRRF